MRDIFDLDERLNSACRRLIEILPARFKGVLPCIRRFIEHHICREAAAQELSGLPSTFYIVRCRRSRSFFVLITLMASASWRSLTARSLHPIQLLGSNKSSHPSSPTPAAAQKNRVAATRWDAPVRPVPWAEYKWDVPVSGQE